MSELVGPGSKSTKKIGNGVLVSLCVTGIIFLMLYPLDNSSSLIAEVSVVGCKFLITAL